MSNNKRRGRAYRIIVILIAYALAGAAIFIPLLSFKQDNKLPIYITFGIFMAALIATIVVNEIIIRKHKKIDNENEWTKGTAES